MQVAIAIGALLLGGWTLDPPVEDGSITTEPVQRAKASAQALPFPLNPTSPTTDQDRMRTNRSSQGTERTRDRATGDAQSPYGQTPYGQAGRTQGRGTQSQMPFAPSDPLTPAAENALGQPSAPTEPQSGDDTLGPPTTKGPLYGSLTPVSPADRTGATRQPGNRSYSSGLLPQTSRQQVLGGMGNAAPLGVEKAYSGYRPQSGVSPYMNLFRRDTLGTVDNYTTLVRPELEQRNLNQTFNRDIHGLQQNTMMQGSMLQQLNNRSNPQGVATPQFYMNYGNYYPGQGQSQGQGYGP